MFIVHTLLHKIELSILCELNTRFLLKAPRAAKWRRSVVTAVPRWSAARPRWHWGPLGGGEARVVFAGRAAAPPPLLRGIQ